MQLEKSFFHGAKDKKEEIEWIFFYLYKNFVQYRVKKGAGLLNKK